MSNKFENHPSQWNGILKFHQYNLHQFSSLLIYENALTQTNLTNIIIPESKHSDTEKLRIVLVQAQNLRHCKNPIYMSWAWHLALDNNKLLLAEKLEVNFFQSKVLLYFPVLLNIFVKCLFAADPVVAAAEVVPAATA